MGDKQRTFLLGAGFSKAVADGPLMNQIWDRIEKAHQNEIKRTILGRNNRLEWFDRLKNFVEELEKEATFRFTQKEFDNIEIGIRENIEYLFTLIDLHLSGPKVKFEKAGVDSSPYPVIPLRITHKFELEEIKSYLLTFLYTIFVNLNADYQAQKFAEKIREEDQIITFNYDIVLEKALWQRKIWSPLNGYVGVVRFNKESDQKKLEEYKIYSQLRIHKMHGSVGWVSSSKGIAIELDNRENWGFHFDGLEKILERNPREPSMPFERQHSVGYIGKHNPPWILPSFIKPFEKIEFYEIWKSALKVMSKTDELVIIGYSFRPEDSNSLLLLAALSDDCNVLLVDPDFENIKERLEKKGVRIKEAYKCLDHFLVRHGRPRP